ncbi:histidinol dehydrogenase [Corynebacterium minutissimum]|uniref:Histidinol dehydrogenase n=1 Tax=Corynebacterium minutissimum TaxID=38301 RepID=A0A2X4RKH7_9CORY|nr:histidinol dehydrogenase [Corynebacterium minutissimum]KHO29100.1 histidinol dehydrogenase [Corynebacterium minutissimum]QPS59248.1 histidinol dehydrogenase [Corynebacterium minutissimum]QQA79963.1 histidinol dehydrogenase [Corynebacterium minutissimum]SQH99498.1 histidinol dehydrogenase [Corynebacterium minutissimum]VEG06365.1 histidinol dehydrogenase [Corynebacterium minutissimum]
MLRTIDLRGEKLSTSRLRRVLPRGGTDVSSVMDTVVPMVEAVRNGGAAAALDFGERFDGVRPEAVRVSADALEKAAADIDPQVRSAIEESMTRVRAVHADQNPSSHTTTLAPGATVTEVFQPIERVGLYVPGGKAVYPSSVIMNAVPAQEAGAEAMVVASPPQKDFGGLPHPTVLATCHMLGVDEVWAVGGGQAIALLAYGDDEPATGEEALEPVDIITGPGNVFVAAAKRAVQGVVGIDAEAGPTEIAILADDTANPVYVAYDLISQAEHDPMAASVLITASEKLAEAVAAEVAQRYTATANAERAAEALRGEQSGIVLVDDLEAGIAVADAYAAEHLEVHTANAREVAERIRHAGAIFVGDNSPVPLGDYTAGSNHVLPTSGTARFSAGLSTHTFLRPVNLVEYDRSALGEVADKVIAFAAAEELPAHGEAIAARFDDSNVPKN